MRRTRQGEEGKKKPGGEKKMPQGGARRRRWAEDGADGWRGGDFGNNK